MILQDFLEFQSEISCKIYELIDIVNDKFLHDDLRIIGFPTSSQSKIEFDVGHDRIFFETEWIDPYDEILDENHEFSLTLNAVNEYINNNNSEIVLQEIKEQIKEQKENDRINSLIHVSQSIASNGEILEFLKDEKFLELLKTQKYPEIRNYFLSK